MMSLKFVVVQFLAILHFAIVIFVVFGFLFSNPRVLMFHLVLLPLLVLHWKTNHGVCYLTQLEYRIQRKPIPKVEMQGGFSEVIFQKLFRRKPTKRLLQNIIYTLMTISWIISCLKLI